MYITLDQIKEKIPELYNQMMASGKDYTNKVFIFNNGSLFALDKQFMADNLGVNTDEMGGSRRINPEANSTGT
jgi:hypothetical protein